MVSSIDHFFYKVKLSARKVKGVVSGRRFKPELGILLMGVNK